MQNLNCKLANKGFFNLQIYYIEAEMKEKFWCKPTFFSQSDFLLCVYDKNVFSWGEIYEILWPNMVVKRLIGHFRYNTRRRTRSFTPAGQASYHWPVGATELSRARSNRLYIAASSETILCAVRVPSPGWKNAWRSQRMNRLRMPRSE